MKQLALVEGDVNLLSKNEILVSEEEGYTILRKRRSSLICAIQRKYRHKYFKGYIWKYY